MIADPCVSEDDHLPRKPVHCEGAVETILRAWMPPRTSDVGDNAIISEPNSVGKTALTQPTLRRLETQVTAERPSGTVRHARERRR